MQSECRQALTSCGPLLYINPGISGVNAPMYYCTQRKAVTAILHSVNSSEVVQGKRSENTLVSIILSGTFPQFVDASLFVTACAPGGCPHKVSELSCNCPIYSVAAHRVDYHLGESLHLWSSPLMVSCHLKFLEKWLPLSSKAVVRANYDQQSLLF